MYAEHTTQRHRCCQPRRFVDSVGKSIYKNDMRYELLLLDLDGTLLDYNQGERHALRQVFGDLNLPFDEHHHPHVYRRINNELWNEYEAGHIDREYLRSTRFRRFFDEIGLSPDSDEFSQRYLAALAASAFLEDGARELLDTLHGRVSLVVVSNGFAAVQYPRLEHAQITHYFDAVIVSDEVRSRKPEAAIFDAALRHPGLRRAAEPERSRCLMVGDGIYSDVAGALAYGIDSCWYNPEGLAFPLEQQPTYEISRLSQVAECLV